MKPRKCGDCTECCTALGVDELEKDNFTKCKHLCKERCGIYHRRPKSCSDFKCCWLAGLGHKNDRPDLIKAVFAISESKLGHVVHLYEMEEDSMNTPRVKKLTEALGHSLPVVVIRKDEKIIIPGPRLKELRNEFGTEL